MSACRNCGSTLEACYARLRESGNMCCPTCITADTHGLIAAGQFKVLDRLEAVEKALAELGGRIDALAAGETDLPDRVDVVEHCLADIERILKLRRKQEAAEPQPEQKPGPLASWWAWFQAKRAEKRAAGDTTWPL
jgi:hypothetical protein